MNYNTNSFKKSVKHNLKKTQIGDAGDGLWNGILFSKCTGIVIGYT